MSSSEFPYHQRYLIERKKEGEWTAFGGRRVDSWKELEGDQQCVRQYLTELGHRRDFRVRRLGVAAYEEVVKQQGWDSD